MRKNQSQTLKDHVRTLVEAWRNSTNTRERLLSLILEIHLRKMGPGRKTRHQYSADIWLANSVARFHAVRSVLSPLKICEMLENAGVIPSAGNVKPGSLARRIYKVYKKFCAIFIEDYREKFRDEGTLNFSDITGPGFQIFLEG